jgi:hypothetical protein
VTGSSVEVGINKEIFDRADFPCRFLLPSFPHGLLATPVVMAGEDLERSISAYLPHAIGAAAAIAAVTHGVNPAHTVRTQCILGRSWGKYFVFHGLATIDDRYNVMQAAFGEDNELFRPRLVDGRYLIYDLQTADYDELIDGAMEKRRLALQNLRPNQWLYTRLQLPTWRWAYRRWVFFGMVFWGLVAYIWMPLVAGLKWYVTHAPPYEVLVMAVTFFTTEAYLGWMLDISERYVRWIRVPESKVSPAKAKDWLRLYGANHFIYDKPPSAEIALYDLQRGTARRLSRESADRVLLVPVMSLRPQVEYEAAKFGYLLMLSRLAILSIPAFTPNIPHNFALGYACAALAQAHLQKSYAAEFVRTTATTSIH